MEGFLEFGIQRPKAEVGIKDFTLPHYLRLSVRQSPTGRVIRNHPTAHIQVPVLIPAASP